MSCGKELSMGVKITCDGGDCNTVKPELVGEKRQYLVINAEDHTRIEPVANWVCDDCVRRDREIPTLLRKYPFDDEGFIPLDIIIERELTQPNSLRNPEQLIDCCEGLGCFSSAGGSYFIHLSKVPVFIRRAREQEKRNAYA